MTGKFAFQMRRPGKELYRTREFAATGTFVGSLLGWADVLFQLGVLLQKMMLGKKKETVVAQISFEDLKKNRK